LLVVSNSQYKNLALLPTPPAFAIIYQLTTINYQLTTRLPLLSTNNYQLTTLPAFAIN